MKNDRYPNVISLKIKLVVVFIIKQKNKIHILIFIS